MQAIDCHRSGRLEDAERLYRGILQVDSANAEVNYRLGALLVETRQPSLGLPYFISALNSDPSRRQYWLGYVDALFQSGKPEEAKEVLAYAKQHGLDGDEINALAGRIEEQLQDVQSVIAKKKSPQATKNGKAKQKTHRHNDSAQAFINALMSSFNERRFAESSSMAQEMTKRYPHHGFGWKMLGVTLSQMGKKAEALNALQKAVKLMPADAETHHNLGLVFNDLARLEEAEKSYLKALQIKPDYAEAHNNIATLLLDEKRYAEAEMHLNKAISLNPDIADVHYNLANMLKGIDRLEEAEKSYRHAIRLRPDYAEAYINLGVVLMMLNRLEEAESCCRKAINIKPDFALAHNNLGIILNDMKRLDEAEACYHKALEINPNSAEIYNNLACVLRRPDDAMECLRLAVKIEPDYPQAYNTMGNVELMRGRLEESAACFRTALEYKPDYALAHSNLIYALDLMDSEDIQTLQAERRQWDAAHGAPFYRDWTHENKPDPERKLRIGYVSADIKDHSATKVFGGMLVNFDREKFDVYAYSNFKGMDDRSTQYFKQHVTVWRSIVGLSDDAAAELIRRDQIDILVDLSGHSAGNRLLVFARKPAPIQITAWGYASGTGMQAMDVFFSDPVMVPHHEKKYYAEEVRYLPCVVGAFYNETFPDVNELPALADGIITFGSHNRLTKLSPTACRVWAEVLLSVPNSRLILKSPETQDPATRERVMGYFTRVGVAAERIIMQGGTTWYEHMRAYNQIDIALDPFPHGGGVTTVEGLMMGVPVVTQIWPTMPGRVSASIMTSLGLPDWVAENSDQFVELAVKKASDLQALSGLRQQLRNILTSSEMGNTASYVRTVEREYRTLWCEWCKKSKEDMK